MSMFSCNIVLFGQLNKCYVVRKFTIIGWRVQLVYKCCTLSLIYILICYTRLESKSVVSRSVHSFGLHLAYMVHVESVDLRLSLSNLNLKILFQNIFVKHCLSTYLRFSREDTLKWVSRSELLAVRLNHSVHSCGCTKRGKMKHCVLKFCIQFNLRKIQ
jgi:hypothetical protein